MNAILVTGGAGFVGSHYVRALLAGKYTGYEDALVTVVDKLTYAGNLANLTDVAGQDRLKVVHGDICDTDLLDAIVPGHDVVVHFAAESHVDRSIASARVFTETNVLGTQALLQACLDAGIPRVVHVSTDEVYGSTLTSAWREDSPVEPNSPYAASKAGGDLVALAYARTYGLNVSITRSCNNYGPHQYPEKVIPVFITRLLDGLDVPLYGDGENVRGWVHVTDHCRGVQLVIDKGEAGEVYHIAGDVHLRNLDLTGKLLEACGAGWDQVRFVPDRPGHDRGYSLDDGRLRAMGYRPAVPFTSGLAATVRWYRDNQQWWRPLIAKTAEPAQ